MKKYFLILFLLAIASTLASVNNRLVLVSNTYNSPSAGQGTLIIGVEAMSDAGDAYIKAMQNAFQLDPTIVTQIVNVTDVTFQNQVFDGTVGPAPFFLKGYNVTEDYTVDGRVRWVYTFDTDNAKVVLVNSSWTRILEVVIVYTMVSSPPDGVVSWYSGSAINYLVSDFSNVEITGSEEPIPSDLQAIPLPVELSSFSVNTVEGAKAQLQWETATEVNNYGFEIQRSIVSSEKAKEKSENEEAAEVEREWEMVAFIEGHGNSNSIKNYSFTDKNLVGGSKFMYRLKQIDIDGTFEYSDAIEIEVLPTKYELLQNYPNPFNPETNIRFSLPENAKIAINIYNILGERVTTLLNKELEAGFHQVNFNTNSAGYKLASGMYIYTIETKNFSQVKKMILLK